MGVTGQPKITPVGKDDKDFTCVTFSPDLARFNLSELSSDMVALLSRRVYDIAGSTQGVKVYLNSKRVPIKCFKDYIDMLTKDL